MNKLRKAFIFYTVIAFMGLLLFMSGATMVGIREFGYPSEIKGETIETDTTTKFGLVVEFSYTYTAGDELEKVEGLILDWCVLEDGDFFMISTVGIELFLEIVSVTYYIDNSYKRIELENVYTDEPIEYTIPYNELDYLVEEYNNGGSTAIVFEYIIDVTYPKDSFPSKILRYGFIGLAVGLIIGVLGGYTLEKKKKEIDLINRSNNTYKQGDF